MTTMQMTAELFQELSTIVKDEDMTRKAIRSLKRIIANKRRDETQYILSSDGMKDIIKQGDEEIKQGGLKPTKVDDLWK